MKICLHINLFIYFLINCIRIIMFKSKNYIKMGNKTNLVTNKMLNHVFSSFGHGLKPMMNNYFVTLDELLIEMSEKAKSENKKKLYVESIRSIRVHKLNVMVSYLKTIQHTFSLFIKKDFDYFKDLYSYQKNKNMTTSPDANDIDEKLVQNILIHKYESTYEKELDVTNSFFSVSLKMKLEPHQNPICPFVMISTFAKSIRLLHLDQNVKMILYKHYELNVMSKMLELYKESNDYILSLKQIDLTVHSEYSDKSSIKTNNHKISQDEIKKILNNLQLHFDKKEKINPNLIKVALMDQLERIQLSESRHIDNHDLYCIDFISMRFQLISDDHNIHHSIKNIIFKLQIPYLKYLTDDDTFIDDKSHPAQVLLETIHNSSIGWSEIRDNDQVFINKLNDLAVIINKPELLTESFFKVILKDYTEFIDQQENEFAKEQNRIKTRERGKSQIIKAMKTVDALIAHKTEDQDLPSFVSDILFGPWKNLLSLLLVRYSDTSLEYLRMVVFIDDLIELLHSDQFDVIKVSKIEELCMVYGEGLELVAYSGDVLDGKIKKLKDKLFEFHKLGKFSQNNGSEENIDSANNVVTKRYKRIVKKPTMNADITQLPSLDGFNKSDAQILSKMTIGEWVEITRHNKENVKAQLSWVNPKSGKYIFVNSRGLKVTDKSPEELLSDLKSNKIFISKL